MNEWNNNPLIKQYEEFSKLSPHNTKAEFARKCGISKSTMTQYLNNKMLVSSNSLEKICKALKCHTNDILERTKEKEA